MNAGTNKKLGHELFTRHPDNPILSVKNWPYNANSVFNAAAAEVNGQTLLLVRVEDFRGLSHFTVARSSNGITDWDIDKDPTLGPDPAKYPEELWIFGPKAAYEREGDVDDVVFPCGWILKNGSIHMYYGAADSCIALATAKLSELLDFVRDCPNHSSPSDWWKS